MDIAEIRRIRRELVERIEWLEREIAPLHEELSRRRSQMDALDRIIQIETSDASTPMPGSTRPAGITDVAASVLADEGSPLHYSVLLDKLTAAGTDVPGRQPGANLIAHLTRDDRFVRVGSGVYALSAWGMKSLPKRLRAKRRKRP